MYHIAMNINNKWSGSIPQRSNRRIMSLLLAAALAGSAGVAILVLPWAYFILGYGGMGGLSYGAVTVLAWAPALGVLCVSNALFSFARRAQVATPVPTEGLRAKSTTGLWAALAYSILVVSVAFLIIDWYLPNSFVVPAVATSLVSWAFFNTLYRLEGNRLDHVGQFAAMLTLLGAILQLLWALW